MYFVYIIRCSGGMLYTGITTDVVRRFAEHSGGVRGAKFTHTHRPEAVEAVWSAPDRSLASKLEYGIKQLSRQQKLELIADNSRLAEYFGSEKAGKYIRQKL